MAMYLVSSHKKGISSHQLARDIEVTQKTAWYILHKIRSLYGKNVSIELSDDVECDEAYIGGQEKYKHESKKHDRIEEIVKAEKAVNDRAKEIMDKHAHKIVYGGKTLKSIRDDEEEAKQKYNAAIQAEASAKTNGGNVAAAAAAVTLARQKYDNAHKKTLDSEKAIKREIKLGNVGTGWGVEAAELQDMTSLYNQYHTAFKDNIDALYDVETYDDATYADLKALANQEPNLFRSNVITADDAENTVVHDESGNTHKTSVAGAIKFSAARVESKMNKESEAARKQQEGKK